MDSIDSVLCDTLLCAGLDSLPDIGVREGVRKHLTGGFLCAVLDLSGTLWPLLIPPGLRNPGISHYGDKYPLPFYGPNGKR